MRSTPIVVQGGDAWTQKQWEILGQGVRARVLRATNDERAWEDVVRTSRGILRAFSTSFFIVTRFLPPEARDQVEVIYAAVRYPDEIVDSFAIDAAERIVRLERWREQYHTALSTAGIREAVIAGVPPVLAAFARVVRANGIPPRHYHDFLDAMRMDATPRPFATLDDLIEGYVHGSAIVVGYFLAHVYGSTSAREFPRALEASRDLGIALQLTNFIRDVAEDQRRGRLYLPLDLFESEGILFPDACDPGQHAVFRRAIGTVAAAAEQHYRHAADGLDAFAPDCRVAIESCIAVYRQLNARILASPAGIAHRESVPLADKLRVLPASKYWRLPLAFMAT